MDRKPVSNPDLADLGKFQGMIDRNSNFRQQAFDHNLSRNVRVVKLLAYLTKMVQNGVSLTGILDCVAAIRQNFSSNRTMTHMGLPAGATQAAHFLPGQIRIDGKPIWLFETSAAARDDIEFLFAEVEHLPVPFNQADSAAEAKGEDGGLCFALTSACTALIRQSGPFRPLAGGRVAPGSNRIHVAHSDSPQGRTFDWSCVGAPHPSSPAGQGFAWSALGLPHPDSPVGRNFDFQTVLRRAIEKRSTRAGLVTKVPKVSRELLQIGFQVWQHEALTSLRNAIARKRAKPGIPPLAGDRFEGYTEESITARSTASSTLSNRDDSLQILEYYLQDQELRTWDWVMSDCQEALQEVDLSYKH